MIAYPALITEETVTVILEPDVYAAMKLARISWPEIVKQDALELFLDSCRPYGKVFTELSRKTVYDELLRLGF
jgi:hypothetical protein